MRKNSAKQAVAMAVIASLVLLAACVVVGSVAYLVSRPDSLANDFIPAKVTCAVEEQFADGVKSDVKIRNTGNVDAYIRAAVVATFRSADGKVLATAPCECAQPAHLHLEMTVDGQPVDPVAALGLEVRYADTTDE